MEEKFEKYTTGTNNISKTVSCVNGSSVSFMQKKKNKKNKNNDLPQIFIPSFRVQPCIQAYSLARTELSGSVFVFMQQNADAASNKAVWGWENNKFFPPT